MVFVCEYLSFYFKPVKTSACACGFLHRKLNETHLKYLWINFKVTSTVSKENDLKSLKNSQTAN